MVWLFFGISHTVFHIDYSLIKIKSMDIELLIQKLFAFFYKRRVSLSVRQL